MMRYLHKASQSTVQIAQMLLQNYMDSSYVCKKGTAAVIRHTYNETVTLDKITNDKMDHFKIIFSLRIIDPCRQDQMNAIDRRL